jgi:hypothetical protein
VLETFFAKKDGKPLPLPPADYHLQIDGPQPAKPAPRRDDPEPDPEAPRVVAEAGTSKALSSPTLNQY